ncbi:class I SAM-dependent methyltransferase [Streptosporangium sandarakinum]|uniref:hypothetical protein n=1 Tax=Streptosporangium sandarakinum TaxID=1260955 RepID=UPI00367AD4B7
MTTTTTSAADRIQRCEEYIHRPRTPYLARKARYDAACHLLFKARISNDDILADVGAGMAELDVCLRVDYGWRGRYVPVDGWLDGTDLETWTPPRSFDWFACLEVLEHLRDPERLVTAMQARATRGLVITTPNPEVWDVLSMDPTHITPISRDMLHDWGFATTLHTFYGKYQDGIAGLWTRR